MPRRADSGARPWPRIMMHPSRSLLTGTTLRRACPRCPAPSNAVLLCGAEFFLGAPTNIAVPIAIASRLTLAFCCKRHDCRLKEVNLLTMATGGYHSSLLPALVGSNATLGG